MLKKIKPLPLSLSALAFLSLAGCSSNASSSSGPYVQSLNSVVAGFDDGSKPADLPMTMMWHMRYLFDQVKAQGLDMTIALGDGAAPVKVLDNKTGDKFLPGKLALGLSWVLIDMKQRNDPAYPEYLAVYKDITKKMMATDAQGKYLYDNLSFGEYYYLLALNNFKDKAMLNEVFDDQMLGVLKNRLNFYDMFKTTGGHTISDYQLNTAQNYYAVAYGIAGLRTRLGWENSPASARDDILAKLLAHYREDSSGGFSDEADNGGGRFDRYSVLLIAETIERSMEMSNEAGITEEMRGYLRKSVDLIWPQLNVDGKGFNYGRSIGPYGDTAFMEILTAAAKQNVLTATEKEVAYAFIERVAKRYSTFWYDPESHSVNMWVKGRGTDAYRGTPRTLGENFSLMHQFLYVNKHWNDMGFKNIASMSQAKLQQKLDALPRMSFNWYNLPTDAKHPYNSGIVTVRDLKRVINLNLSQAPGYNSNTPYFPVPYVDDVIYGTTDVGYPLLLPQITLPTNESFAPVSYYKNLKVTQEGTKTTVTYDMPHYRLIRDKNDKEKKDSPVTLKLASRTTFVFDRNTITRTEVITPQEDIPISKIQTDFTSYAKLADTVKSADGKSVTFKNSDVTSYSTTGYEQCAAPVDFSVDARSKTPIGRLNTRITCTSGASTLLAGQTYTFSWTVKYKDLP